MSSINIDRAANPDKSDAEIAEVIAKKYGFILVVRYKNLTRPSEFSNFGLCETEEELQAYLSSPGCNHTEIIYDGRGTALHVIEELILKGGHCELCDKPTSLASLQLGYGNDFYICPQCGLMSCEECYVNLPLLTASHGYGLCPTCHVKVQLALPRFYMRSSDLRTF
ncbi:MAG: hypothetical protein HN868_02105 [Gammaproteobacteria bacterium]|jgi:hypothetical protein|nr:hypothetical protein [Gammaproteobacteria bacterium]